MLRSSCYPCRTLHLMTQVNGVGHASDPPGFCGNSKQTMHTSYPAYEHCAGKFIGGAPGQHVGEASGRG